MRPQRCAVGRWTFGRGAGRDGCSECWIFDSNGSVLVGWSFLRCWMAVVAGKRVERDCAGGSSLYGGGGVCERGEAIGGRRDAVCVRRHF